MRRSLLWGLVVAACGCMTTNVANLVETEEAAGNDEAALWKQADAFAVQLQDSGLIVSEDPFDDYLASIADRLTNASMSALDERVRVNLVRSPDVNAFALPNGDIYLMSGLVAKLAREDQLASIIGHEIGHVYDRHSLRQYRNMRNKQRASAVGVLTFGLAAAVAAGQAAGNLVGALVGAAGDFWTVVMVTGYSREFEHRSDELSVAWLDQAGFDPHASAETFAILLEAAEESDAEAPPVWHSTHPKLRDRVERSREQATTLAPQGAVHSAVPEVFTSLVAFSVVENARALAAAGDYEEAESALESLEPGSNRVRTYADAELIRAHMARHREGDTGIDAAIAFYKRAIAIDPTHAAAYRELGLLSRSTARRRAAASALKQYIELAPDASDRGIIESYIEDLEG